jgi:iron complex outermembrane recepter protein
MPTPRIVALVEFDILLKAYTSGVELAAQWQPITAWRVEGNDSAFRLTPHLSPLSQDASAAGTDGRAPSQQWRVRSALTLGRGVTADATLWGVGALHREPVPAHTRTDLRIEWPLTTALSIDAVGEHVFGQDHLESTASRPACCPPSCPDPRVCA